MDQEWAERVRQRLAETGLTMKAASLAAGLNESFVRDMLQRKRVPSIDKFASLARVLGTTASQLLGEIEPSSAPAAIVPLMGFVGAGAQIEPEFEQTPPEGLDQIHLAIPVPDDMLAFQVKGFSMLPRYDDGDVIIVWREQKRGTDSFLGEEAAVRTGAGKRFLKTIRRGQRGYNLESWNDHPIENQQIDWVGEIYVTIRASQLRRIVNQIGRQGGIQGQLRLRDA